METARLAAQWTWYGHVFIWEVMRSSLGDLSMYENLILDPGWLMDFNRVYSDFFKAHYKILFDEVGLPDGVWVLDDLAYNKGLFASPEIMRKLFLPFYAELIDFFDQYDLQAIFHSDGNVRDVIPFILEAGFAGLNLIEAKAGNDLLELAEMYGDQLVFFGGMDVRVMETNDRQRIQDETIRLIEGMKSRNARWVFGSDHTISPLVHYDSYRYLLEIYHRHRTI